MPPLFVRFVLIMKGTVLENSLYLRLRNVFILDLRLYFISFSAIMSESDLKQEIIQKFVPTLMAKSVGPPPKN